MRSNKIMLGALVILLFFYPTAQAKNSSIEFKLVGGISLPSILDPNSFIKGYNRYLNDYGRAEGLELTGGLEKLGLGLDFQGEVILRLSERIGLGLGLGYSRVQKTGDNVTMSSSDRNLGVTLDNKGSIIPLMLNGYYFFPFSSRARLSLGAGIGYYLADWTYNRTIVERIGAGYAESVHYELSSQKIGFQASLGMEWDMSRRFSLVIEGFGRFARLGDFSGDWTYTSDGHRDSGRGTLFYFEWYDLEKGEWYTELSVSNDPPHDVNLRNIRKAVINFSGFSLRVGFKIRL